MSCTLYLRCPDQHTRSFSAESCIVRDTQDAVPRQTGQFHTHCKRPRHNFATEMVMRHADIHVVLNKKCMPQIATEASQKCRPQASRTHCEGPASQMPNKVGDVAIADPIDTSSFAQTQRPGQVRDKPWIYVADMSLIPHTNPARSMSNEP